MTLHCARSHAGSEIRGTLYDGNAATPLAKDDRHDLCLVSKKSEVDCESGGGEFV